jgi:hypothetical protein
MQALSRPLPPQAHEEVLKLCLQFKIANDDSHNVAIRDRLNVIFKAHDKVQPVILKPNQVGILPTNRDGDGITPVGARLRGKRMLQSGVSKNSIGIPWAFEDNPQTRYIEKYTMELTALSKEYAQVKPGEIRVGPANWTHCNHFLNMVMQEVPCDDPQLPCEKGRLSKTDCRKDAMLADIIDDGLQWQVFPWDVAESYPLVPQIFQSACNTEQQVQEGEGWVQMLLKINARASEMRKNTSKNVSNDDIKRAVLRSQPPRAESVPDMVDFDQKWGGGDGGYYVKNIALFCKLHGIPPDRHVSNRHFKALAALDFGLDAPAMAVNAVLKRIVISDKVQDGCAIYGTVGDIGALTSKEKKGHFLAVNAAMERVQGVLTENDLTDTASGKAFDELQMDLVDIVLKKPLRNGKDFKSADDCVKGFLTSLLGCAMDEPSSNNEQEVDTNRAAIQYDEVGKATGVGKMTASNKGYKVDACVYKENKLDQWVITAMTDPGAQLTKLTRSGEKTVAISEVTYQELIGKYRLAAQKIKILENYPASEAKHNVEMSKDAWETCVKNCLHALTNETGDQPVRIQSTPYRGLFANEAINAGKLVLVPSTKSVAFADPSKADMKGVRAKVIVEPDKTIVLNSLPCDKKLSAAFWCVNQEKDNEKVNVELQARTVHYLLPSTKTLVASSKNVKTMEIPCYVNVKDIRPDEEILVRKVDAEKPEKKIAITFGSASSSGKKQKL